MKRKIGIVLALAALILAVIGFGFPIVVKRYAEGKVDAALKRIGYQTTSMVQRGDVSVDIWSWTVSARDVAIVGAGGQSSVRLGRLTVARPNDASGRMTADRLVLDEVKIDAPGETISIPRVEIQNYAAPRKGLTATPGLGRDPVTQADLFEELSIDRLIAPVVTFAGDKAPLKRTVRNLVVSKIRGGVVEAATADSITVEAAYVPPEQLGPSSVLLSTGAVLYRELSLPALLRFYEGDPKEDRQPLVKSVRFSKVEASLALRPGGRFTASIGQLQAEDVKIRPLGFPLSAFDPIATRMRFGRDATPQEVRDQLSFAIGLTRAISFDQISATNGRMEVLSDGKSLTTGGFAVAEVGPYADARIESVRIENAAYGAAGGLKFLLTTGKAFGFNATGILEHADRIARNEVLLTTKPTPDEVVKIVPRINAIDAQGFELSNPEGKLKAERARVDIDAPLDAVPQRVTFRLDGLFAAPPQNTRAQDWIERLELDKLKGSAKFSLTLNPKDKTLSLDWLDYSFEQLGTLKAAGKLENVDALLAVATGADFVDKFSAIELAPFKLTLDDGGVANVLLRRAAEKAGQDPDAYRDWVATETRSTITRLLGPPAESSGEAAAEFVRDPRAIEVTLAPRKRGQTLLDLIRAWDLGLAGLAQVVDVQALYRR